MTLVITSHGLVFFFPTRARTYDFTFDEMECIMPQVSLCTLQNIHPLVAYRLFTPNNAPRHAAWQSSNHSPQSLFSTLLVMKGRWLVAIDAIDVVVVVVVIEYGIRRAGQW